MTDERADRAYEQDIDAVLGLTEAQRASQRRRRLGALFGAAAFLALLGYWYIQGTGNRSDGPDYVVAATERRDLTVIVTATGAVEPTNQVDVSSELSGIIKAVLVDFNSQVRRGDALAELDTDKLEAAVVSARARLAAAKAQVAEAEATVEEMRLEFQRKQTLESRRAGSAQDLDIARASYERAKASRKRAEADVEATAADLRIAETNLAKACICSPIDGIVLRRDAEPGQTVASSLQAPVLFTIAEDLTQMEIQVDVDEADVGQVREGQSATFTVDAYPDRVFEARIRELRYGSEIVQGVVTYKAVLTTENKDLLLRPGMTATAEIMVAKVEDALSVPNEALRFRPPDSESESSKESFFQKLIPRRPNFRPPSPHESGGSDRVIHILVGTTATPVPIRIGASDGRWTEIVEGDIEPGAAVIVGMRQGDG
ncbi:efflux RND transporter periplasmic adaptor subunit [Nisaea sediminum]|uniref:efflux RND transporter periplasmic adaptor subunit n=1 Tax=Nisaea sediminum TaxID=2775867 RepID=UPI0018671426|nr:efflux RND transporter periplasmic adaptor subunit [Nisaea sediminum]